MKRYFLPLLAVIAITGLLSVDILDEIWGGLPDPGCIVLEQTADTLLGVELWQGLEQTFGQAGIPQVWINVQGRVHTRWGVSTLSYALNNHSAEALSLGPTERRLACAGDFNIEIPIKALSPGENHITIQASDKRGNQVRQTINLNFTAGQTWPLPYAVDWETVGQIGDVVQIVDGQWQLTPDGLRPQTISYDRTVALGDLSWTNYQFNGRMLLHRIDPTESPSNGAGLGIAVHWQGHSDEPIECGQPRCGWWAQRATAWYGWDEYGRSSGLSIRGHADALLAENLNIDLQPGTWYDFAFAVEIAPGEGESYHLKIWPSATPEPQAWTLVGTQPLGAPESGSILLVAHHVDATFGNLEVIPLP